MSKYIVINNFTIIVDENYDGTYSCNGFTNPHGEKVFYGDTVKYSLLSDLKKEYIRRIETENMISLRGSDKTEVD